MPSRWRNESLAASRARTTASMLTSTRFHALAVVCMEATMFRAMAWRILVSGMDSSRAPASAARGAGAAAGAGTSRGGAAGASAGRGWAAGAAAGAACPDSMYVWMSFLVIRPPVPVPWTRDRSTWFSSARRRTSGDRICERGPRSGASSVRGEGAGAGRVSSVGGWRGASGDLSSACPLAGSSSSG